MLTIESEQVPLLKSRQMAILTCCKVTLGDSVDLPPLSETVACESLGQTQQYGMGYLGAR